MNCKINIKTDCKHLKIIKEPIYPELLSEDPFMHNFVRTTCFYCGQIWKRDFNPKKEENKFIICNPLFSQDVLVIVSDFCTESILKFGTIHDSMKKLIPSMTKIKNIIKPNIFLRIENCYFHLCELENGQAVYVHDSFVDGKRNILRQICA